MWFVIYYTPELDRVGRVYPMSIYAPMGEAIEWICMELGLRQAEWTFAFGPPDDDFMGNVVWEEGSLHVTPHEMGYVEGPDASEAICCYPKVANN